MKSKLIERTNHEAPWTYPGLFYNIKRGHVFLVKDEGGPMTCLVSGKYEAGHDDYGKDVFPIGYHTDKPDASFNAKNFIQLKGNISIEFDL